MMCKTYCQVSKGGGKSLVANRVEIAQGFFPRLRGLLGRKYLGEGEGMLLWPCSSIHCVGMKFSIDAIFLDKSYRVVAVREKMRPGSFASCRQARCVLELKAGEIQRHKIELNQQLQIAFEPNENRAS